MQERQRIASQLMEINEKQQKQREEKLELIRRLEAMQEKLLFGGVNLLDENQQQEQQLRVQAQQLEQAAVSAFSIIKKFFIHLHPA